MSCLDSLTLNNSISSCTYDHVFDPTPFRSLTVAGTRTIFLHARFAGSGYNISLARGSTAQSKFTLGVEWAARLRNKPCAGQRSRMRHLYKCATTGFGEVYIIPFTFTIHQRWCAVLFDPSWEILLEHTSSCWKKTKKRVCHYFLTPRFLSQSLFVDKFRSTSWSLGCDMHCHFCPISRGKQNSST